MRSRNGYFSLLFTICAIVCISSKPLRGDEYFISYRYVVKNTILYNDSLEVSRAMVHCNGTSGLSLTMGTNGSKDLRKIILHHFDRFSTYIGKLGLEIQSSLSDNDAVANSFIIVTLRPKCFTVDFNPTFVKITALNQTDN